MIGFFLKNMVPLLSDKGDRNLLIAYRLNDEEEICEAIVNAFYAANIDVHQRPTEIHDWINTDVFSVLQWSSDRPHLLSTRIWDHRVVITAEEVRIYTS